METKSASDVMNWIWNCLWSGGNFPNYRLKIHCRRCMYRRNFENFCRRSRSSSSSSSRKVFLFLQVFFRWSRGSRHCRLKNRCYFAPCSLSVRSSRINYFSFLNIRFYFSFFGLLYRIEVRSDVSGFRAEGPATTSQPCRCRAAPPTLPCTCSSPVMPRARNKSTIRHVHRSVDQTKFFQSAPLPIGAVCPTFASFLESVSPNDVQPTHPPVSSPAVRSDVLGLRAAGTAATSQPHAAPPTLPSTVFSPVMPRARSRSTTRHVHRSVELIEFFQSA